MEKILEIEDFTSYLECENRIIAINKIIKVIIEHGTNAELRYHLFWDKIRSKYDLDLNKNYMINRSNGVITELENVDTKINVKRNVNNFHISRELEGFENIKTICKYLQGGKCTYKCNDSEIECKEQTCIILQEEKE